ncbi:MAG: hypothetical protein IJ875_07440, partial [Solobacterium sp.]|nr:hypothetical protein [Solobacterium sp.]
LVYDSIDQLRNISTHDLENPPMIYEFSFTGIEKNDDGYYPLSTFLNHLQLAIDEYKTILNQYPQARPIVDTSAK